MAGTAFGIAGRRQTMKKKRKISPQVFKKYLNSRLKSSTEKTILKKQCQLLSAEPRNFTINNNKNEKRQPKEKKCLKLILVLKE